MTTLPVLFIGGATAALLIIALLVLLPMLYRVVVETNKVHIVQSGKKTTSYGSGQDVGNVYYAWPGWVPVFGITRVVLPVSNFNIDLKSYKAYDKDRVPFELDLTAFFRINDTNRAAERVPSLEMLHHQLTSVVQGAARKILASHDINQIMTDRATFGEAFTSEVSKELANWGVEPVKNMELMDIRDADDSRVIHNIMAKKASHIEMESRTEVAQNKKSAQEAEIRAQQAIDIAQEAANQATGERAAERTKAVGIADETAKQEVREAQKLTAEKDVAVQRVTQVRTAEIVRDTAVLRAEQDKATAILSAEAALETTRRAAEGIQVEGNAKAAAETAILLAPVNAQITLAKEIGGNEGYQNYLVNLRKVEAGVTVGVAQATALEKADIKVIANAGTPSTGLTSVGQLFTPEGGTALGSMLEGLANTPEGKTLLSKIVSAAVK